ncbi:MAG: glycoside hydrolase family 125 protein [Kiritimatiellae bacterium]|nr:glycoside hydrolase family 125 protein [Kiritimatiellia bacterium]
MPICAGTLEDAQADARRFAEGVAAHIEDAELAGMFTRCYLDTITRTVEYSEDGEGREDSFVVTGDIPAMWLRDSCAQVWPYLEVAKTSEAMRKVLRGVLARVYRCIAIDPYANAFNKEPGHSMWESDLTAMKPELHERKWELDSLAYPMRLAHGYWKATGDSTPFGAEWEKTIKTILATMREQQKKGGNRTSYTFKRRTYTPYGTLADGIGAPAKPTGMVASAFRPSDDACILPFNIPGNIFAAHALRLAAETTRETGGDEALALDCEVLAGEMEEGVAKYGVVEHPAFGRIYAYEVDGYGARMIMDDANAPSLLSLPYLCGVKTDDAVYAATRRMVLSDANPWFFGEGVGSPHTGEGRVWPMAVAMRALTSDCAEEIGAAIAQLKATTGGTGVMHESYKVGDAADFTRSWFAWADGLFAEAVLRNHER